MSASGERLRWVRSWNVCFCAGLVFSAALMSLVATLLSATRRGVIIVTPETRAVNVGTLVPGEIRVYLIKLRNTTSTSARVVGFKADCTCIKATKLPLVLPPATNVDLELSVEATSDTRRFVHRGIIFLSDGLPHINVAFEGTVKGAAAADPRTSESGRWSSDSEGTLERMVVR